jgi:hypothetical protein
MTSRRTTDRLAAAGARRPGLVRADGDAAAAGGAIILRKERANMPGQVLARIRNAVALGDYDLTFHAVEEMAEDNLEIWDLEEAVLNGDLTKTETDDPRGTRYTIVGTGTDGSTVVGVVGRFKETGVFLVITAYAVTE